MQPGFDVRVVAIAPRGELECVDARWRDALVLVESGAVELEASGGARRRFERGAMLCLAGLGVATLRNGGDEPALLVAAWRRGGRSAGAGERPARDL